jgi:hypothetical protein
MLSYLHQLFNVEVDRKIKSPFASWVWMPQRLLPAALVRWRQWEKTDRDALGQEYTQSEVCHPCPGAHGADELTRVVVALGDPVEWCLARTGRRDGGWVYREFQMAKDLADHLALCDDGDEP